MSENIKSHFSTQTIIINCHENTTFQVKSSQLNFLLEKIHITFFNNNDAKSDHVHQTPNFQSHTHTHEKKHAAGFPTQKFNKFRARVNKQTSPFSFIPNIPQFVLECTRRGNSNFHRSVFHEF